MTADLAAFLLARLAEDEAVARAASPGPWRYGDIESVAGGSLYDPDVMIASVDWDNAPVDPRIRRFRPAEQADATGAHIAHHDPARVLADVEAKRRIIALHGDQHDCVGERPGYEWPYTGCSTLRLLALPFAGHENYREEWKS